MRCMVCVWCKICVVLNICVVWLGLGCMCGVWRCVWCVWCRECVVCVVCVWCVYEITFRLIRVVSLGRLFFIF